MEVILAKPNAGLARLYAFRVIEQLNRRHVVRSLYASLLFDVAAAPVVVKSLLFLFQRPLP